MLCPVPCTVQVRTHPRRKLRQLPRAVSNCTTVMYDVVLFRVIQQGRVWSGFGIHIAYATAPEALSVSPSFAAPSSKSCRSLLVSCCVREQLVAIYDP